MQINTLTPFLQIYVLAISAILGLVIGSFLNVVALRLLSGESFVLPCSKCTKCKNPIKWYDNIPVLSYLILGGKCRHCKEKISIQYPIVEATTGFFFFAIVSSFGLTVNSLFLIFLTCCMIVMTITDFREKLIFDMTSIPLIPIGLLYNFFNIGHTAQGVVKIPFEGIGMTLSVNDVFVSAIIGAIIGALFFEVFSRLGLLLVGQYAFGGGDTIIGAALGAWFGWKLILVILALSFVFQLIVGIPVIVNNMYKDKDYKSIIWLCLLLFTVAIPPIAQKIGLTKHIISALIITLITFIIAIKAIFVILGKAKERQSFTFLPFGPALVFGGFIVMFYGEPILNLYLKSFS